MPRQRGQRQSFTFNKGWNTEASPLTFPENTAQDLENVVLDVDGSIRRRMGVITKDQFGLRWNIDSYSNYRTKAISVNRWENVAGSGDLIYIVSQYGTQLYISDEDGVEVATISFSSQVVGGGSLEAEKDTIQVASGLGYLFVTGLYIDPFYLEYNVEDGSVTLNTIDIKVRDFEGVDDGLNVDSRPSTLSGSHLYNLRNQGWPTSFPPVSGSSDPITRTKDVLGVYPSNADIIYYGKTETADTASDIGKYNPSLLARNVFGSSPAAKGSIILDAFIRQRTASGSGVTFTSTETFTTRPRAIAFHNGRVFYAGLNTVGRTGEVYYSQQLTNVDKVGNCYQQNDPTAEEFNELLATDGGVINIPDCGNILRIEEGSSGIVVFASNGMWEITGQEGKFSATEFYVRKVTDIGCIGKDTIVNADGTFFYWSDSGIVGTQSDQITGNISADVITQTSIQLGYLLFGGPQRRGARGVWIRGEKKVVWLYSTSSSYDGVTDRFKYNGVLVLDTILGAFYKYRISDLNANQPPYIAGIFESQNVVTASIEENVTDGGINVTDSSANVTVNIEGNDADSITSTWKLLTVRFDQGSNSFCNMDFATFAYRGFRDWYYEDGVGADYNSFLETGYDYSGAAMYDKQPTYVYTYMSRVSKSNLSGGFYNIPDPSSTSSYQSFIGSLDGGGICSSFAFSNCSGVAVKPGEEYIYVYNNSSDILYEIQMSTPGDLGTASLTGVTFSMAANTSGLQSLNGVWWTVRKNSSPYTVYVYRATVPYDITTLSLFGTFNASNGSRTCWQTIDGSKFYYFDNTGERLYEAAVDYDTNTFTNTNTASITTVGNTAAFDASFEKVLIYKNFYNITNYNYNNGAPTDTGDIIDIGSTAATFCAWEPVVGTSFYYTDNSGADTVRKYCIT